MLFRSGLALARDAQTGLREDLRILVMSATLDGARVAKLLRDAAVIESEGRAFPVETRYLGRKVDAPLERQMANAIATALRADPGSVLAFLPGAAEIRRTQNFLAERIHDAGIEIAPENLRVVGVMHRKSTEERIDFFLTATAWSGEIANREPDKCDQLAWFDLDRLPENVIPYVRRALDNYRRGRWFDSFGWE